MPSAIKTLSFPPKPRTPLRSSLCLPSRPALRFLCIIYLLFLIPLSQGYERYSPRTPSELPLGTFQDEGVRVRNARVLYLNLPGLRRSFPGMIAHLDRPGQTDRQIWQNWAHWIKTNFAYISKAQLLLNGVRHSAFDVDMGDTKKFYRPIYSDRHRYSRAAVEEAFGPDDEPMGLIDIKGAGYAQDLVESQINIQVRAHRQAAQDQRELAKLWVQDHNDGLMAGGESVAELIRQRQIQMIFDIENAKNGTDFQTTEVLFLMDLGIGIFKPTGNIPAFLCGRESHWGRQENLTVPESIYTDEHGHMQHTYFNAAIDFGGARIHYGKFASLSQSTDGSDSIDPQENKIWAWSHDTALAAAREGTDVAIMNHVEKMTLDYAAQQSRALVRSGAGPFSAAELERTRLTDQTRRGELGEMIRYIKTNIHIPSNFIKYLLLQIRTEDIDKFLSQFNPNERLTLLNTYLDSAPGGKSSLGRIPLPLWFYPKIFNDSTTSVRAKIIALLRDALAAKNAPPLLELAELAAVAQSPQYDASTRLAALNGFLAHAPKGSTAKVLVEVMLSTDDQNLLQRAHLQLESVDWNGAGESLKTYLRRASSDRKYHWLRPTFLAALKTSHAQGFVPFILEMLTEELNRPQLNTSFVFDLRKAIRKFPDEQIVQYALAIYETEPNPRAKSLIAINLLEHHPSRTALDELLKIIESQTDDFLRSSAYIALLTTRNLEIPEATLAAALQENSRIQEVALSILRYDRFKPHALDYLRVLMRTQGLEKTQEDAVFFNRARDVARDLDDEQKSELIRQTLASEYPALFRRWAASLFTLFSAVIPSDLISQAAQDPDEIVRQVALDQLTRPNGTEIEGLPKILTAALNDPSFPVMRAAIEALAVHHETEWAFRLAVQAAPFLAIETRAPDFHVRRSLSSHLSHIFAQKRIVTATEWSQAMSTLFQSPDLAVKNAVVQSLNTAEEATLDASRGLLLRALSPNENPEARSLAVIALMNRTDYAQLIPHYLLTAQAPEVSNQTRLSVGFERMPDDALKSVVEMALGETLSPLTFTALRAVKMRRVFLEEAALIRALQIQDDKLDEKLVEYVRTHTEHSRYESFLEKLEEKRAVVVRPLSSCGEKYLK